MKIHAVIPAKAGPGAAPSWFDKLTMRAREDAGLPEDLILSLSKDEVRASWVPAFAGMTPWGRL